jgi:hypothetical protein
MLSLFFRGKMSQIENDVYYDVINKNDSKSVNDVKEIITDLKSDLKTDQQSK